MTLLARNEADIVDAQLAFHLHAGVDFVIATDNRSNDGTAEIFERYERAGVLHLIREEGDDMRQDEWVTRMARLAATEFGADWVINSDADEFWWPRGGSLKEVFATVPERFGVVRGCWRHFLPRPDDGGFFAERMTVRLAVPAFPGDKQTIFHAHQKVAHRATPDVVVEDGNHDATGSGLEVVRWWHPIEVLHFSFRSIVQLERKADGGWHRNRGRSATLHQRVLRDALLGQRVAALYGAHTVQDDALAQGLTDGTLAIDTRLRDALRTLRAPDGSFLPIQSDRCLLFERPGLREDALYAAETSTLGQVDGVVRAGMRVDLLERRLAQLERPPLGRLRLQLRRLRRAAVD
jgi:hypothetical protein